MLNKILSSLGLVERNLTVQDILNMEIDYHPVRHIGGEVWEVDSATQDAVYAVHTDESGWWCTCKGFRFSKPVKECSHIEKVVMESGLMPVLRGADDEWVRDYVQRINCVGSRDAYTGEVRETQGNGWSMRVHY